MGCVNRSSKEFKQLALTNNVDANTLELITHKYWMERGSEDLFPTDLYIQAQLGNTQYQEPGESVRQLWNQQYSSPQEYSSLEQLQIAHREAMKFFPQSALVHYKDAKGNFVLSVKQPVESANYDKDSFFNEDNVKKLDLGLEEGQAYTIDKVEELFNRFNTDKTTKHLADKVFKIAKDLGLGIKFDQSLPWGNIGRYTSNNTITYKKSFFELDIRNNMKAPILLHEVLHALSMYALSKQTAKWEKPEQLEQFKTEMNSIFEQVKDNPLLKGEKGVEDIYEFVAELANPIFRQKLQSIDKKSVWHKILDAFKSFLGIKTTSTYYQRAMNSLDNALEAFDLDTYLKYNGVRNLMQQGYDANEWQFRDMTEGELKEAVKDYFKQQLPISTELKPETQKTLDQAKKEAKASRSNFTYATETDDTGEYQKQSVQQRMDDFMSHYGDLVKDIKPFSNKYGGMSFTVTFKTPTELLRDQNSEILSQLSLIDSMSKDQLISEFALIEQEYADYDLITEDGTKDSEKSSTFASDMAKSGNKKSVGPQPFTFNDGTTVTAPFKPNAQQAAALNAMNDFVHSDETSMTLSGYAGTGKTSLMELLAQKMRKERKDVRFCATTNKAAAVLKARVAKAGFDAQTLNKVFGINVEVDATKAYNARNLVTALKEADVFPGTTVIIDEASMINEENYRILNQIAQQNGLKIIYVGDKAQLAPVNETQVSKVFRNTEGRVVELTQVERTDDNAILKEATNIRNGKPLSGESSFNDKGEGVAFLTKKSNEQINDVIKHYIQGLQNDPNYFRILAYTNKAVTDYNNYVRNLLGYEDPIPHVGEPVVGYANWGYEWRTKSYRFINSESYKVIGVGNPTTKQISVNGETITMETVPITLQNSIGEMDTFNFMDIKANQTNRQAAIQLANAKKQLWEKARRAVGRNEKAEIYQAINSIDQFLFVNDNIEDANHNLLQAKTLDFGYALTIHKSQGSTFTHVLMDDIDVAKASNSNNVADAMSLVDLGQVNVSTSAMEVQATEGVGLGDLSAVEATPATTSDNNTANVRQQLEYVGVSRATNTVTVISNNVKKEDSPLNHLNNKGNTLYNNKGDNKISNEADTLIIKEVLDHLKNIGFSVKSRADMEKFFKEHPNALAAIQQFIGKKARTKFEQQLMKARPDLATPSYNMNRVSFEKDVFSDEFINSQITPEEANVLKEKGLIKDGSFGLYALTEKGIANSTVSYPQIESVLNFLHSLEDNKENTAYIKTAIRWIANNSLTLPQDNVKARQAFDLARKRNIDLQKYNTLGELIASDEMKPKEKKKVPFNPDKAKTFSNKRTVTTEGGRTFTVYDVENTEEGQREVCKALAANYAMSPWCLSTFTATGEPTESAKNFWEQYNGISRKIAFENGKPVAFSSDAEKAKLESFDVKKGMDGKTLMIEAYPSEKNMEKLTKLAQEGLVELSKYDKGTAWLTEKGEQIVDYGDSNREAWWDMEDAFPSPSLNDAILNQEMLEEKKNQLAQMIPENFFDEYENEGDRLLANFDPDANFELYVTPEGEIYGFVDKDGNIYLDETIISPEHPIHEYTHLWDRVVAEKNPKLWKRGVELMKQTSVWKEIEESEQYGKKWKAMQNMPADKLENLIASEVHARFTGEGGAQLLEQLSKERGQKGIISKLKQWILDFWKDLRATFSDWSDEEINKLTLKDFNHMPVRDFADNVNFQEAQKQNPTLPSDKSNLTNGKNQFSEEQESEGTRVSLPSYEYFMDRHEDTLVDAEWKTPLLQQLENQLTSLLEIATTPESDAWNQIQDVTDKMTKILEAKSEADLLPQTEEEGKKENKTVETNLSEYDKLTQQINNLLDSNVITASEIRHIAELVVNSISDNITLLQKEDGLAQEQFSTLQTDLDFSTASRRDIVNAVGINRLIHRAKVLFSPEVANYEDIETMMQAALITDNWDAIMTLAADIFAANEGFGISKDYNSGGFTTTSADKIEIDIDNFNDYHNDAEAVAEEKDEQEHWQVEQRTIDILNSMSQQVRLALHECYQMDKNGNKVYSKWGIAERVNPRQAVNSILRWTQGSLTLEDMVKRMSDKSIQNPWLNQLIERLNDKSGKETDFQSQFYGVFSKHFQPYSVVLLEDGKYHTIPVNSHPALTEAMNTITTQFKIGEHPLFTESGKINSKLLGTKSTTYPEADFNLHKALSNLQTIQDRINHGEQLNDSMAKDAAANIMGVCRIMGYTVTEEMLSDAITTENLKDMTEKLGYIVDDLDKELSAQRRDSSKQYNPFAFGVDNSIGGTLRNFLTPITEKLEDTAINAFYDSGKMYQSYVTPSFMTKLMNKFRLEGQEFEDFIMNEYGNSEWFKFPGGDFNKGWRNEWLRLLARDENARKVFDHKVELNFNKHNYMRNMSDAEYTLSLITEYFAETGQKGQSMVPAWFRIPMLSNKPSSEFVKFMSYRGDNYKAEIVNGLYQMFLQELSRIQTVNMRNKSKEDPSFIKNFDSNGKKFNFLPFLNDYLNGYGNLLAKRAAILGQDFNQGQQNDKELARLMERKASGLKELELNTQEEARLSTLVKQAIQQDMEDRVSRILNEWENNGILEAAKSIQDIYPKELEDSQINQWIKNQVENFLWNDSFASKNILQLTIADIAFYKDAEDLQKRLAQLHAPGIRGNIAATDYEGNRVSDGTYRTFILQDFDSFKSNIIANIAEVFDRRIAAAPESQKAGLKALKESLVGKDGKYTKINVTDAQGYSSPASYRKKAFIFGRWSREAEDIYQKLQRGEYTYTDLETAFQPLKPFVYSHLQKDMGVENAPIQNMPVPFQAKNAEYLLIMADAILQGEELGRPNLLRAVYRVMEESERLNPTKGIDTVQFESAIKSGLQGKINIHQFAEMPNGEEAAYNYIMSQIYQKGTTQYDAETFVHEAPYEDYCLQQEVPEHFKEHSQAHGSQIRMITPSDLDFYKNPSADHSDPNNQVFYEWTEPDGTKKKLRADEFRREYEETIAANISESIDNLAAELHFNSNDKRERNIALSKILQREILSSPRYGIDLIQACSIDKETGEFRIPKGDPIQAKRIEQLINSIIKNRVNKQKIAGGPIVQVSNFGTSRQLHIRFNDKNGGVLMTKEEYEQNPQKKQMSQTDKFNAKYKGKAASDTMSYEEYVKENQAGIAYFEVFAPIWSDELFEKFANEDGSINIEAIEATDPELLKMVSYRIPTEDKYSCAPMKVVGFMPREAGDAIMLPYELTEIDDSDFDVDKRYVMMKNYPKDSKGNIFLKKPSHIIRKELFNIVDESYQKKYGTTAPAKIADEVEVFLLDPANEKDKSPLKKWLYSHYQRIAYETKPPMSGRFYRDNKIVDMTLAVLTNEMTADKILNPGGFDGPKRMGYMVAAFKNPANSFTWEQLQSKTIDELKDLSYQDKDLTWADTQIQFYKQNSAAASLIGVFAVNKVAHATLESNGYQVAVDEICGQEPFTIADTEFGGRMEIDKKYDQNGALIGKTLGSLVSASADAVKDPILNLMNVNMTTAGTLNTMLRLGMSFEDAALFLSQNVIERVLNEFNRENLTNYQPLSIIIEQHLQEYRDKYDIADDSAINSEPLTREEMVEGLLPQDHEVIDYKVLLAFQKLRKLTDAIRKPTFATRFNSISSAVGPLIIDNLITEHRMENFMSMDSEEGTHFYDAEGNIVDIDDIFYDHPVLKQFSRTIDIAKLMFSDMPAGSTGFRNLLATLPEGLVDKVFNDKKLLDSLSNFYQSYLLIASRMVNPANLKNYIEGFPKYFSEQKFKEKYPDNALIQAIKMNVSKRTGRVFLSINITGIDEAQKEIYRNAWIDLHKENPELSKRLFEYCFFRTGIGFSPKTFMALVPTYVKERLSTELIDGTKTTYVDTYRYFPSVNPNVVIDQWVRNNWDNNKLVPKKGGEGTKYQVDLKNGRLIVKDAQDMADLKGVTYMKTRKNGQTYMWKLIGSEDESMKERVYRMVKPLGNNGEYMEMSLSDIVKPLSETKETIEDMRESELNQVSNQESDAAEESKTDVVTASEKSTHYSELTDAIIKLREQHGLNTSKTEAENILGQMKENPKKYQGFIKNVLQQLGINSSEENTLNEFNKIC